MSLYLQQIFYYVRTGIGELQQFQWSDQQIISDINFVVQEMSSVAGTLTKFSNVLLQLNSTTGIQEAALDVQIDKVKSCKYFSGTLFELLPRDWKSLQTGNSAGSIPSYYYLKTSTTDLTPQLNSTSDISQIQINPFAQVYRTVLGIWPTIPTPANIHVWYSYVHPWMMDPGDPCEIPSRFIRGIAAGTIARCLEIEKAYSEADRYTQVFDKYKEDYRIYAAGQRQADRPAKYGSITEPWRDSASSSVIFLDPNPH